MFNTKAIVGFIGGILLINFISICFVENTFIRILIGAVFIMINLLFAWKYIYPKIKTDA
jgi:hypothetical protein